jgi:hypothetical protein
MHQKSEALCFGIEDHTSPVAGLGRFAATLIQTKQWRIWPPSDYDWTVIEQKFVGNGNNYPPRTVLASAFVRQLYVATKSRWLR